MTDGGRNNALTQVAGSLRARGLNEQEIFDALMVAPEREDARGLLPEHQVRSVARSIAKYPPGEPRVAPQILAQLSAILALAQRRGWNAEWLEKHLGCRGHELLEFNGKTYRRVVEFLMRNDKGDVVSRRLRPADRPTFGDNGPKSLSEKGKPTGLFMVYPLPAEGPVAVLEGEADIAAVVSAGWLAVVGTPGANPGKKVLQYAQRLLAGRVVVLFPDGDSAGEKWLETVGRALRLAGCNVRFVPALPGLDVDKRLVQETDRAAALREMVETAMPWRPTADSGGTGNNKPTIMTGPDLYRVVDESSAALLNAPDVYERAGQLVTVLIEGESKIRGFREKVSGPRIHPLVSASVLETLSREAHYMKISKTDGAAVATLPPKDVVAALIARCRWPGMRPLVGVSPNPLFVLGGRVLATDGYDAETGIFIASSIRIALVPDRPTAAEVKTAKADLEEIVCDFPFKTAADRSAWFAGLLTMLARFAIAGPCPLFAITKNIKGCGGSLGADAMHVLVVGKPFARMAPTNQDEEMRKRITSVLLHGIPYVLFDNVAGGLGCPALDAAVTGMSWTDRTLGENRIVQDLPLNVVWFCTGNNIEFLGDTSRRVLPIRLHSLDENPESRSTFRHPSLLRWISKNRARLIGACFTLLRGFASAGCPNQGLSSIGSFEDWSELIRGTIVWADWPDPAETRIEVLISGDLDRRFIEAMLGLLREIDPSGRGLNAAEIISKSDQPEHKSVLAETAPPGKDAPTPVSLGKRLRRIHGRNVGGYVLTGKPHQGTFFWKVERADLGGDDGDGGDCLSPTRENSEIEKKDAARWNNPTIPINPHGDVFAAAASAGAGTASAQADSMFDVAERRRGGSL